MLGRAPATRWLSTVALLGVLLVAVAAPADAAAGDLTARGERAFAEIAACAATADHLLVAIVVDESSSLQRTDPGNDRVGAIEAAIDALETVQAGSGGRVTVEASLATFSGSYTELVPWGVVSGRHADVLLRAASSDLPGRNAGEYTDYRAALSGAAGALAERAAAVGTGACSVILWLTDGQLDVPGSGEADAWRELCEPNGLVDGIRRAGSSIVAVALAADSGSQAAVWREDLRAVAEGMGGGATCGSVPLSAGETPGAYLRADEPSALRRLFAGVGALIRGGTPASSVRCPGAQCLGGTFPIAVDAGVSGFRAVLEGTSDAARLLAPDGSRVEVRPGSSTVAGADLTVSSRDGLTVVSVTHPGGAPESSVWRLETGATADAPTVVDLYVVWGAALTISAPEGVIVGQPSRLLVTLRYPDGSRVPREAFEAFRVRLLAGDAEIPLTWDSDGTAAGEVEVPAGSAVAAVSLAAAASATSAPSGTMLGETRASLVVPTALPAAYPRLDTASLTFGTLVGAAAGDGALRLVGAERGATRACLSGTSLEGPSRAGGLALAAPECVDIPAGERVEWPFTLTADAVADGSVAGAATVTLTAVDGQRMDIALDVAAVMVRPVNEPLRWGIAAALVAVGLLVPLVIGWVSNAVLGRFPASPRTMVAVVPVLFSARGPRRGDGAEPLVRADDFRYAGYAEAGRVREVHVADLVFRRSLPLWPLGEPSAWFSSGNTREVVASTDRREPFSHGGRRARADFGLASHLYLAVSRTADDAGEFPGRLVCVGTDDAGLAELARAAAGSASAGSDVWAQIYRELRSLTPEPETGTPAGPGGQEGVGVAQGGAGESPPVDEDAAPADDAPVPATAGGYRPPSIFGAGAAPAKSPPLTRTASSPERPGAPPPAGRPASIPPAGRPPSIFD